MLIAFYHLLPFVYMMMCTSSCKKEYSLAADCRYLDAAVLEATGLTLLGMYRKALVDIGETSVTL